MNRISQLLNLRPGEWKLVVPLLLLLTLNTIVGELLQVVATSGFVSKVGAPSLPWVWMIDMAALLIFAALYSLVVDRVKRVQLVAWLLGGFAVIYLMIQLLFFYGVPEGINYFLLFIFADQQFFIFPLAFWALASDVFRIAEAKRLFPVIGAGYAFGSIIGNSAAASSASIFARYGGEPFQLLGLAAVLLLIGVALLLFAFRNRTLPSRQSKENQINIRESFTVGLDFFNNVPLFRYLGIVVLLGYLGYTIIQYHFLSVLNSAFASDLQFQAFFGSYRVALIVVTLLAQWLLTGRLLERVGLKSSFVVFPAAVFLASTSGLAVVGLVGGAMGVFVMELVERAWDQPVRKSLQGLIPDERRGRVTTFMDTYLLAVATIAACVFLLVILNVAVVAQISAYFTAVIYLVVAGVAGLAGVWAAWRARAEYDQSMLNWRLSRRQRKGFTGVMKKLDF